MLSLLSKLKGIKFEMILWILLERILSYHLGYTPTLQWDDQHIWLME